MPQLPLESHEIQPPRPHQHLCFGCVIIEHRCYLADLYAQLSVPIGSSPVTAHYAFHGFKTCTRVSAKSLTLCETTVRLWWSAVAASRPSIVESVFPSLLAVAASRPHLSATGTSIGRILPAKRAPSSISSHVSRCVRRLP